MNLYRVNGEIVYLFYDGKEALSRETISKLRIENATEDLFHKLLTFSGIEWNVPKGYAFSALMGVFHETIHVAYHQSQFFPSTDRDYFVASLDFDHSIKLEDISEHMKKQAISYFERRKEEAEKFIISLQTS